ncbi:MAG: hypothetical protein CL920_09090 [Deltaproteobacteria bacterium]|nr:hypothetical protein [Deltaproteobacteria bacterium]|tara:strand:- start:4146 stop:5447 length:1302 start_codon:yes stop_codon:yes gene_type:complete
MNTKNVLLAVSTLFLLCLTGCPEGYDYDTFPGIGRSVGLQDGTKDLTRFFYPYGLATDAKGNLLVADSGNHKIRFYQADTQETKELNRGTSDSIQSPTGIAVHSYTSAQNEEVHSIYFSDTGHHKIRVYEAKGAQYTFNNSLNLAGTGLAGFRDGPSDIALFNHPTALALFTPKADDIRMKGEDPNALQPTIFVTDTENHVIRAITHITDRNCKKPLSVGQDMTGFCVYTVAGNRKCRALRQPIPHFDGCIEEDDTREWVSGDNAFFHKPGGIASDKCGNLYVSDTQNHRIRKLTFTCGADEADPFRAGCYRAKTIAGSSEINPITKKRIPSKGMQDGPGAEASFNFPQGIYVDQKGRIFVADFNNHRIRVLTQAGEYNCTNDNAYTVKTIDVRLYKPFDLVLTPDQKTIYVTTTWPQRHMIFEIADFEASIQ